MFNIIKLHHKSDHVLLHDQSTFAHAHGHIVINVNTYAEFY